VYINFRKMTVVCMYVHRLAKSKTCHWEKSWKEKFVQNVGGRLGLCSVILYLDGPRVLSKLWLQVETIEQVSLMLLDDAGIGVIAGELW